MLTALILLACFCLAYTVAALNPERTISAVKNRASCLWLGDPSWLWCNELPFDWNRFHDDRFRQFCREWDSHPLDDADPEVYDRCDQCGDCLYVGETCPACHPSHY